MQRFDWRFAAAGAVAVAVVVLIAVMNGGDSSVTVKNVAPETEDLADAAPAPEASDDPADDPAEPEPEIEPDSLSPDAPETPTSDASEEPAAAPEPKPEPEVQSPPDNQPVSDGQGCILSLHGAGTAPPSNFEMWSEGVMFLQPHSGNTEFPFFWLYDGPHDTANDPGDTDKPYNDLVAYLTATLDEYDCGPTMLYGASNGGGFAARLYCSGEDFGGRVWGVMVDDPVPDAGVVGCSPSANIERTLFVHSTEVITEAARFENDRCSRSPTLEFPWYCQDDIGFDLAEYEAHIGQESVLGREVHLGVNNPETNFWNIVLGWWYDYDPVTYAHLAGR